MLYRRAILGLATVSAVLLIPSLGSASSFAPVSDAQLAREATDIVHGRIVDIHVDWDDQGKAIWTTALIEVASVLKGKRAVGALLEVKEIGGTVDGYTIKAHGFPMFTKGQEVVALLRPWDDGSNVYRVWGYQRGLFHVYRMKGRAPAAYRYDLIEAGKATMFTDRLQPAIWLENLNRELRTLARSK
jgi:hypothetical protein